MTIADEVGRELYRRGGYMPSRVPEAGSVDIALSIFGENVIRFNALALVDADLSTVRGSRCIVIRDGLSGRRMNFVVAEQLARLWLEGESWFANLGAKGAETLRAIGAWLVIPPEALRDAISRWGQNIGALAEFFHVTETCIVRRISECGGPDSVITTPTTIHRNGKLLHGFGDAEVRAIAARRAPKSVRRVEVHDEPGRVALFPLAS